MTSSAHARSAPRPRRRLAALVVAGCAVLLTAACGDDDADRGGVVGSLSCERDFVDLWVVEPGRAGELLVEVDTVRFETAFDPEFAVLLVDERPASVDDLTPESTTLVAQSDDAFDCTFPPPAYQCPRARGDVDADDVFVVLVAIVGDCRSDVAEYRLVTRLDGDPVDADYLGELFDP